MATSNYGETRLADLDVQYRQALAADDAEWLRDIREERLELREAMRAERFGCEPVAANIALAAALRAETLDDRWTFAAELGGGVTGVTLDMSDLLPDLPAGAALELTAGVDGRHVSWEVGYVPADEDAWHHASVVLGGGEDVATLGEAARAVLAALDGVAETLRHGWTVDDEGALVQVDG